MFTINNKLEIVENQKRAREGAPWTEEEIRFLVQRTLRGFYPDVTAFALQRNKYEVIVKGLEMGLFLVERVDFHISEQEYLDIFGTSGPQIETAGAENYWNEFSVDPRTLDKIEYMAEVFCDILWYNWHISRKYRVEQGLETLDPEIWAQALAAEERIRQKYGEGKLGPFNDYELGMLYGKLSALRWVMGSEWDMLDL